MGTGFIVWFFLVILFSVIVLFVAAIFMMKNRFVMLENKVNQSESGIDVFLTKRFDLIPNLVETIKGYINYEENALVHLTEKRQVYMENKDLKTGNELNENLNNLLVLVENNPGLKASESFLSLQKSLEDIEGDLEAARRLYNSDVTMYNNSLQEFPNFIFARILGYKEKELFKAEDDARSNVSSME